MLLQKRIKMLMSNDLHVSWKSLPEVKSSGLLQMLSKRQIALEELKFCLITHEVAFNTELAELLNLSKRSVSWADPLPAFKKRAIASTIERMKHCSDGFLNALGKQWNMKPVVNLTALNKMFEDMAPHLQNYVTYCSHQEDLRTVLRIAMRSKYEIVAASYSSLLKMERAMLPLQHLKLYHLLFQHIHSMLLSTTNHLENFRCKRILTDIAKLLEECYKILETLHGSQYVEKLDRILDESLHGFELEPADSNTSQHHENNLSDTNSNSSEKSSLPDVTANECSSVKQQCLNVQILERSSRDMVKCDNKFNVTVKRQKTTEACGRKAGCIALTWNCLPSNIENCAVYAKGQAIKNLHKTNSYLIKSKYPAPKFIDSNHNTAMGDRQLCSCLYETASVPARSEGSWKHVALLESKVNITVDTNETVHITFSDNSNQKPPDTSVISTDSHHLCIPNLSENVTYSGTESSCVKDGITERSVHDKLKVKSCNNFLQRSKTQNQIAPPLGLGCTNCDELSEQLTVHEQLQTRSVLINCTPQAPPLLNFPLKNDAHRIGLQTESESCAYEADREAHSTRLNKEEKCSVNLSLLSNQLHKYGSPTSDTPSSVPKNISSAQETAPKKSCISEQLPSHEKRMFISSYDFGCLSKLHEPQLSLQEENTVLDEVYNHYEPMNESIRRNCNKPKTANLCESLDWKVTGTNRTESHIIVNDCGNIYEECKPCVTNNRIISTCDVPFCKACNSGGVKHSNIKVEENIYTEPDGHVYEEINFSFKLEPKCNDKEISIPRLQIIKPTGTSKRILWADINEVVRSGLLDQMDASQIALQETKYEMITSEASYLKFLSILETIFITSKELSDRRVLPEEDHVTLFSSIMKVKQCSEKFLAVLLDGWQQDLILGNLCHAVNKFVSSDNFKVYVDCCANQIYIDKALGRLKLTNSEFTNAVRVLESDPACQMFSMQTFLTLPMQRVTRLPLLVQAIIRRLPTDHIEHRVWSDTLVQLQKIAKECDEAAGKAQTLAMQLCNLRVQTQNVNMKQHSQEKKRKSVWEILKLTKQKVTPL